MGVTENFGLTYDGQCPLVLLLMLLIKKIVLSGYSCNFQLNLTILKIT